MGALTLSTSSSDPLKTAEKTDGAVVQPPSVTSVKDIFSDLFESSQSVVPPPSSAPRAIVSGQAAGSLYADLILAGSIGATSSNSSTTVASASRGVAPVNIKKTTNVIHRDIFLGGLTLPEGEGGTGSTNKKVRTAQGDLVLAKKGDYQFEPDDDDDAGGDSDDDAGGGEEADDGENKSKSKGKKKGPKAGDLASGEGPRKNSHPTGLNRAARRALANGNGGGAL